MEVGDSRLPGRDRKKPFCVAVLVARQTLSTSKHGGAAGCGGGGGGGALTLWMS